MIEFYLDTADVAVAKRFSRYLPLRGITTNPSILAEADKGLNETLSAMQNVLGGTPRFYAQVVSITAEEMVQEARMLSELPYDIVVKVPATENGLVAINRMKKENICVLATAIYSVHQGMMAALCGADYVAPYVNRIDMLNGGGVRVVEDLQLFIKQNQFQTKILAASFKNIRQVVDVMKLGISAITLPADIMTQIVIEPTVQSAIIKFEQDWKKVFGDKLSYES